MQDYMAFDPSFLDQLFVTVRYNIGNIFSMEMYAFLLVLGVYLVIHLVSYLAR